MQCAYIYSMIYFTVSWQRFKIFLKHFFMYRVQFVGNLLFRLSTHTSSRTINHCNFKHMCIGTSGKVKYILFYPAQFEGKALHFSFCVVPQFPRHHDLDMKVGKRTRPIIWAIYCLSNQGLCCYCFFAW